MTDASAYLEDAAHFPGGHAAGIVFPRSAAEAGGLVAAAPTVLPIGAQSSLTGGATPMGELIVATSRLTHILERTPGSIRVEAGLTVAAMQDALAREGSWFPPAPTYTGACAGGIVATNAAGAATFKYGTTRDWVEALTVVLADGSVHHLRRRESRAHDGVLEIAGTAVPVPGYRLPDVPKCSAGYFAGAEMDAVDLFVGSEGTLGVITDVTFRVLSPVAAVAMAMIPCRSESLAITFVSALRRAAIETWRSRDPLGIDISAIEHVDRRSIAILREDGALVKYHVSVPEGTEVLLFAQLELPIETTAESAYEEIASALQDDTSGAALARFCRLLSAHELLSATELALPGDTHRLAEFIAVREAVPAGVNARVGHAQRTIDGRIAKTAADMIVPFERFAEMNDIYRRSFDGRRLDYAIWGHISDGNVHPNVIPRSYDDVVRGREAILEFGREVVRLGGSPLAEHGVGRNPVKQELLRQLYGDDGIEQMRAVKRALDPRGKFAPGVIFPR